MGLYDHLDQKSFKAGDPEEGKGFFNAPADDNVEAIVAAGPRKKRTILDEGGQQNGQFNVVDDNLEELFNKIRVKVLDLQSIPTADLMAEIQRRLK